MSRLTFTLSPEKRNGNGHVELIRLPDNTVVEQEAWDTLAEEIKGEKTLIHYPSLVLETRWQYEHAAVTVFENRVVSYICLAPIYSHINRHKFAEVLGINPACMPQIDVYEFTTAWTAPEWRRYGISGQMRPPLLGHAFRPGVLGASGMAGLASPVLSKLGWQITGWGKLPFTSSLTAVPIDEFCTEAVTGWRPPGNLRRYEGDHIPLDNSSHPWSEFTYFWISSLALAETLNGQLAEATDHDLSRWRKAVVDVYCAPEELHRVAFIN